MKMNETVHNCLMAVFYRDVRYIVEVNEDVWKYESDKISGKTPRNIVEYLHSYIPELLKAPARVELDEAQKCEIYLLDLSSETPTFRFHLRREHFAYGPSPGNTGIDSMLADICPKCGRQRPRVRTG